MKKHYALIVFLSGSIYGAASEDGDASYLAILDDAKVAIASDMPGALDKLQNFSLQGREEDVKSLLDYALRAKGTYGARYVEELTAILEKNAKREICLPGRSFSAPALRRSETLTLLDVAIMRGNVHGVKELLKNINPNLSVCRLINDGKSGGYSVADALDILIKKKQNAEFYYASQHISATADELLEIKKLIHEHQKSKKTLFKRFKDTFTKQ
jgi:hypothetical protein